MLCRAGVRSAITLAPRLLLMRWWAGRTSCWADQSSCWRCSAPAPTGPVWHLMTISQRTTDW